MPIKVKNNNSQLLVISKYIVEYYNLTKPVKLQKILYFLFLEYLKEDKGVLFKEDFEAWIYGPVLPELFTFIKKNGFNFSEIEKDGHIEVISPLKDKKIIRFINQRIGKYLIYESGELAEMAHDTLPWIKAREGLKINEMSHNKLSLEDMKIYANSVNFEWEKRW